MRRMFFIVALALAFVVSAGAQDRIYMSDSRVVEAVVDEVSDSYVYYRLYGNQEGPVCSTATYNVVRIVYQNGEEQTFAGGDYYDERIFLEERMRGLLGDQPLKMRFDDGQLYLGSRGRYGAMQADIIAFNLYGDEYYAARKNRRVGYGLIWAGSAVALCGIGIMSVEGLSAGGGLITGAGAICLGFGIPILNKGNTRLKNIAKDYNEKYATAEKSVQLTFGPCRNGVGFALNF